MALRLSPFGFAMVFYRLARRGRRDVYRLRGVSQSLLYVNLLYGFADLTHAVRSHLEKKRARVYEDSLSHYML